MREIKLRYTFQHGETGRIASVIKNLDDEGPYLDHPSNKWTLLGRDQYTGLKDKNNTEMYGGDIFRTYRFNDTWDNGGIGDISWERAAFRFNWKILLSKKGERYHRNPISTICSTVAYGSEGREGGIEIIGNIYENPELLENND